MWPGADGWSLLLWQSPPPRLRSPCLPLRSEGRTGGKKKTESFERGKHTFIQ